MDNWWAKLKFYISEEKASVTSQIVKLIHEDAPKNKFSILSGSLRRLEDIASKMEAIENQQES